jgi:hypothetical protein
MPVEGEGPIVQVYSGLHDATFHVDLNDVRANPLHSTHSDAYETGYAIGLDGEPFPMFVVESAADAMRAGWEAGVIERGKRRYYRVHTTGAEIHDATALEWDYTDPERGTMVWLTAPSGAVYGLHRSEIARIERGRQAVACAVCAGIHNHDLDCPNRWIEQQAREARYIADEEECEKDRSAPNFRHSL